MSNDKLIISDFHDGCLLGFHMCDNRLVRIYNFNDVSVLGNIYCGYVKDVVKNINAAFVDIDTDKKGYLSLKGISQNIHQGDKILVQVSGDKIKSKEYSLTTKINLNSECLVLTAGNTNISISKKITDEALRNELKNMLMQFHNDEFGFILRTNSTGFSSGEIKEQAEKLIRKWEDINQSFRHASPKSALEKRNYLEDVCKEYVKKTNCGIITDNSMVFEKLAACGLDIAYNENGKISLSNKYSLEKHLRQALNRKVWLKSGAYIIIEPTEALTVIDINTGKAECRTNRKETIRKINIEAAAEIVRQIQVRNLSGIIIIDFINMDSDDDYIWLEQYMQDIVRDDFAQCYIVGFTKLGLLEISRRKKEKPLHEFVKKLD